MIKILLTSGLVIWKISFKFEHDNEGVEDIREWNLFLLQVSVIDVTEAANPL